MNVLKQIIKNKYFYILVLALVAVPFFFISYFYILAQRTGLEGRRGGPQDAFRHIYASAFTARYVSPRVVKLVTKISERNPHSVHDQMDRHNNRLGVRIGLSQVPNLYQAVLDKVHHAQITPETEDHAQILEPRKWQSRDIFLFKSE